MVISIDKKIKKILSYLPYVVVFLTLLSLFFLSKATEGSQKFEQFYIPLLYSSISGIIFLILIVTIIVLKALNRYRLAIPGASLSMAILWRTLLLAFIPIVFISFFAFKFLGYEFQSSFDKGINDALNNALVLSKKSLSMHATQALNKTRAIATIIANYEYNQLQTQLDDIREKSKAYELAVFDEKGFIQSFSSLDTEKVIPVIPSHEDFIRATQQATFVIDTDKKLFRIKTLVRIHKIGPPNYYLQAIFYIPDSVSELAEQVNKTVAERDRISYLMPKVSDSFIMVLILVVSLSGLLLVLSSINFSNDIAKPIRVLIDGTKKVSRGNFSQQLFARRHDDFGVLIASFNQMMSSLKKATNEVELNKNKLESERAYLETVINHMTSGVITLDNRLRLLTYNEQAQKLLACSLLPAIGCAVDNLPAGLDDYKSLIEQLSLQSLQAKQKQTAEIEVGIDHQGDNKQLIANATMLPLSDRLKEGYVIIFDEVGFYLQKQKEAAWEEVARRLAHEIKNPLTPILLAAERLNYKLGEHLADKEKQLLNRSIEVISNQVKSMKSMVDDFSDFARPLSSKKIPISIEQIVKNVFYLYREQSSTIHFQLHLSALKDQVMGNEHLIRQMLNNLIKNAIEATEKQLQGQIEVVTKNQDDTIIISVKDNGIGLSPNNEKLFDPYMTTKEKGTGLGLAIVKKIVQAHRGKIVLHNNVDQPGAMAVVYLPLLKVVSTLNYSKDS